MLSVVIPVFNEEAVITGTVSHLLEQSAPHEVEVLVVDGGSTDNTVSKATAAGAIVVRSPRKGRSAQMNEGARIARGDVLYFLHADSRPPSTYASDIRQAMSDGFDTGCFRLQFDTDHWFLRINAWFTRFDINALRFGDQSLFATSSVFAKSGGFCERHILLEDQEIITRLRRHANFKIIAKPIITSARKYVENGVFKMQGIFFLIYAMYRLGYSQQSMLAAYRRMIRQDKL